MSTTPEPEPSSPTQGHHDHAGGHGKTGMAALTLGCLGVVFGDIGTSPLYTFQECLAHHGGTPTTDVVYGLLSMMFWSLMAVVTFKYVTVLLNADNHGEGGILALLALVPPHHRRIVAGHIGPISLMVIAGAALLFGDGVITPAISVLSAIEGLKSINAGLERYVVPITIAILLGLFSVQRRGTEALGAAFGPVMLVWFSTIGLLGLKSIVGNPSVLWALSPHYAVNFLVHNGVWHSLALLGSVVLTVTGGEALYADMGHFGKRPIRFAWLGLVMPALVLCYFGQGALVLARPEAATSTFFSMVSGVPTRMALVVLAAMATIIASQSLISAVFSLSHQAIRLGFLPRMKVLHTSKDVMGQIYVPFVNWSLAISCIALVAVFQKSSALAAAYGLAVSGTMGLTSLIFYRAALNVWGWSRGKAMAVVGLFLCFDIPFLLGTLLKFFHGGYIPFAIGAVLFALMVIWCRGRSLLRDYYESRLPSLDSLPARIEALGVRKVPGAGVYLTSDLDRIPKVMDSHMRALRSIFETVVLVNVSTASVPYVDPADRLQAERILNDTVHQVKLSYGFMEVPDIPRDIGEFLASIPETQTEAPKYLLGRESFLATNAGRMSALSESVFGFLSKVALDATSDFRLPSEQVIEINNRVDL